MDIPYHEHAMPPRYVILWTCHTFKACPLLTCNLLRFSYCFFPFILNPSVKADILKVESLVQMRHELQDAFFRAMFAGLQSPYLVIEVRRDYIIRDAMLQLERTRTQDLKKQLRVQFVGEEGVDEGGVQKEFFQLIVREIFEPKYGKPAIEEDVYGSQSSCTEDEVALLASHLDGITPSDLHVHPTSLTSFGLYACDMVQACSVSMNHPACTGSPHVKEMIGSPWKNTD